MLSDVFTTETRIAYFVGNLYLFSGCNHMHFFTFLEA